MKNFLLIVMVLVIYNPAFTRAEQISNLIMPVSYFVDHVKQLNLLKENFKVNTTLWLSFNDAQRLIKYFESKS